MAEAAEHCSPGRALSARAPSLSIHAFEVFVGPAERSVRRTPRTRQCPRALRVNQLPLSFKGSESLKFSTTLTP